MYEASLNLIPEVIIKDKKETNNRKKVQQHTRADD